MLTTDVIVTSSPGVGLALMQVSNGSDQEGITA
jgi:hypothetical protein